MTRSTHTVTLFLQRGDPISPIDIAHGRTFILLRNTWFGAVCEILGWILNTDADLYFTNLCNVRHKSKELSLDNA